MKSDVQIFYFAKEKKMNPFQQHIQFHFSP